MANRFEVVESPFSRGERIIIEHLGDDMINQPVRVYGNPEIAKDICKFMNTPAAFMSKETATKVGELIEMFSEAGGGAVTREDIIMTAIDLLHQKFKEVVRDGMEG